MWMKLAAEGIALGIALLSTWLKSKGHEVTPKELADKAQKYIDDNQADLSTAEGRDDDRWGG